MVSVWSFALHMELRFSLGLPFEGSKGFLLEFLRIRASGKDPYAWCSYPIFVCVSRVFQRGHLANLGKVVVIQTVFGTVG